MNCDTTLLNAYADGELDLMIEVDLEKHLATCRECTSETRAIRGLRASFTDPTLKFTAPAELRTNIAAIRAEAVEAGVRRSSSEPSSLTHRPSLMRWIPGLAIATVLLLVFAFMFFRSQPSTDDLIANDLVSDHVRSMMVDHLADVASTDQHTVKPWFDGKLDYSPPVTDLGAQGFPLTGGRLDYAAGRPVAALVYTRRLHPINLFILPTGAGDARPGMSTHQGFNLVHWTRQGMTFWAVSDLNLDELQQFAQLLGAE